MANVIKHKRGSGSDPVANDLVVGEVAIRTDVGKLFTKMDNGSVAEIAGGGSDIAINTLSSSSATGGGSATFNGSAYRFTLSAPPSVSAQQLLVSINGVIQKPVAGTGQPSEGFSVDGTDIILGDAPATGSDFFILTFKSLGVSEPADNSVTSAKIVDGAIVNADINASAAIAGTKISPDFGSQAISTTGTLACGDITSSDGNGNLTLKDNNHTGNNTEHKISFTASDNTELINFISPFGEQHLRLRHGSTELVKFQVDGKVGIGTTSPQKLLDVRGEFAISNSNASYWDFDRDDSDGSLKIKDTGTERMRIDTSGNLTLGGFTPPTDLSSAAMPSLFIDSNKNNIFGTSTSLFFTQNAYFNTGNSYQYVAAAAASQYKQESGGHIFLTATTGSAGADFTFSERMRIDSSGNVGIGTTSPSSLLHVSGTGIPTIKLEDTDAAGGYAHFEVNGSALFLESYDEDGTEGQILFKNATTEAMRILTNGNVGIGTSSPSYPLDVQAASGDASMRLSAAGTGSSDDTLFRLQIGGTSANNYIYFGDSDDSNAGQVRYSHGSNFMSVHTNASEALRIDSSGNVGIGTTSPGSIFHVQPLDETNFLVRNEGSTVVLASETNSGRDNNRGMALEATSFEFIEGGSEKMRIDASGRVGIGTASPAQLLEIHGASNPAILLKDTTNNVLSYLYSQDLVGAVGTASNHPFVFNVNNGEKMRITSAGLVGIGTTSPSVKTQISVSDTTAYSASTISANQFQLSITNTGAAGVAGLLFVTEPSSGNGGHCGIRALSTGSGDSALTFSTRGSSTQAERLRIDSSGNVGVGTTSPANKLHVEDSASGVIVAKQTTNNGGFNTFEGKASGGTTTFYASHNGRVGAADGIIFGSDTAAANILDDYEEGTFTFSEANIAVANLEAKYTKIGRVVMLSARLNFGTSSNTSTLNFTGLPFTPDSGAGNSTCGGVIPEQNLGLGAIFMAVEHGNNTVRIRKDSGQVINPSNASGKSLRFVLHYIAAS